MKVFLNFLFFCILNLAPLNGIAETMINGAGATFPYPLYTKWSWEFYKLHPEIKINYQSVGSGGGIRLLLNNMVDFAASDIPMNDAQMKKASLPVLHIPVAMGAIVISYNLPGIKTGLKLDAELIADIFLGKIENWNHPRILALNKDLEIPSLPILVAHRSDGSGTTAIFTKYLSQLDKDWKKRVASGTAVNWPIGLGGKGNEGVAGLIEQNPGSIGYIELIYAEKNKLAYASLKNKLGEFVLPTTASVTSAMNGIELPEDLRTSVIDPVGKGVYPICGISYILVYRTQASEKTLNFVSFLRWALDEGQKYLEPLKFAPLPPEVLQKVRKAVETIHSVSK